MQNTALQLVLQAGIVVKGVLLLLLFFSVMSWAIIFYKLSFFSKAGKENDLFLRFYRGEKDPSALRKSTRSLICSPVANLFNSVYTESNLSDINDIKRELRIFEAKENSKLERYLNFLATTGSTTPFIGLFGTVWGIMNSFSGIGAAGSASLAIVAPGIAEALIATAAGLAAAIPAVISYNYFVGKAKRMSIELEDFSEDMAHLLSGSVK